MDDCGGYGVVLRELPTELLRGVASNAEGWRYGMEATAAARESALQEELDGEIDDLMSGEPQVRRACRPGRGVTTFKEAPRAVTGQQSDWKLLVRGR